MNLQTKLDYLTSNINPADGEPAYEDAVGHLCDLLEFCRKRIVTSRGMMHATLESMVRRYGSNSDIVEE